MGLFFFSFFLSVAATAQITANYLFHPSISQSNNYTPSYRWENPVPIKAISWSEMALFDSLGPKKTIIASPGKSNATPKTHEHSPKKATILALALPGAGQIYNRKYWKVPVVYGAMGYTTYKMLQNRSKMRTLNDSIRGLYVIGKSPSAQLIAQRDKFRGNRDVAILLMAGIYVLQAVDATVDAHFYKFNINDDIAIWANPNPSKVLALHWTIK